MRYVILGFSRMRKIVKPKEVPNRWGLNSSGPSEPCLYCKTRSYAANAWAWSNHSGIPYTFIGPFLLSSIIMVQNLTKKRKWSKSAREKRLIFVRKKERKDMYMSNWLINEAFNGRHHSAKNNPPSQKKKNTNTNKKERGKLKARSISKLTNSMYYASPWQLTFATEFSYY